MKEISKKKITRLVAIDPVCQYYLHTVAKQGWLGTSSIFKCRRLITEWSDLLKPEFIGTGRATRILVKGENIIHFMKDHDQRS